jgi:tRNA threonylcarbamoyl adenosine modification protein (Sua5/YciO/YrdC/YwlC family)
LVTGHWSLVTGHWSLVIGHWSLVIGHWSLVIGHWSLVTGYGSLLFVICKFATMLLKIYDKNPSEKLIRSTARVLEEGGVVIFPTDTIYAIGCNIYSPKALERVARIKGLNPKNANFSFLCYDLSQLSDYTRPISNEVYKLMRRTLPGPYTYILNANSNIPKILGNKKKTVGIRIPDNNVLLEIIKELGNPIMSTSVHDDDEILEYTTDPELIHERYKELVDLVIDGGHGDNTPSTIIDCTGEEIVVVREGKGEIE